MLDRTNPQAWQPPQDHPWRKANAADAKRHRDRAIAFEPSTVTSFPARVWEPTAHRDGVTYWSSREPTEDDERRRAALLAELTAEPREVSNG